MINLLMLRIYTTRQGWMWNGREELNLMKREHGGLGFIELEFIVECLL